MPGSSPPRTPPVADSGRASIRRRVRGKREQVGSAPPDSNRANKRGRSSHDGGNRAPIVVFAGMLTIAITCLTIVLVSNCRRDQPYLDPVEIRPGSPDRVPPPGPDTPPPPALKGPAGAETTPGAAGAGAQDLTAPPDKAPPAAPDQKDPGPDAP